MAAILSKGRWVNLGSGNGIVFTRTNDDPYMYHQDSMS